MAGETDAGGNRRRALDEFLEARVAEGYRIEAHEATHAIVAQGDASLLGRLVGRRRRRFVVQVDDHGTVSMRPAEPVRHQSRPRLRLMLEQTGGEGHAIVSTMARCYYCGASQPKRRLRPLELSTAGDVTVCRDEASCQDRSRVGALVPARATPIGATGSSSRTRARTRYRWTLIVGLLIFGMLLLPHLTIAGRHWHLFALPQPPVPRRLLERGQRREDLRSRNRQRLPRAGEPLVLEPSERRPFSWSMTETMLLRWLRASMSKGRTPR